MIYLSNERSLHYEFFRLGASIVKDIQDDIFELGYKSIEISIDEENIGSLRLFEKAGFAFVSKEAELLNFVYKKE